MDPREGSTGTIAKAPMRKILSPLRPRISPGSYGADPEDHGIGGPCLTSWADVKGVVGGGAEY